MTTVAPAETLAPEVVGRIAPQTLPEPVKPTKVRIDSIDLLRGIVMVIMMLDHTRDYVHYAVLRFDPLDLTQTNTLLFCTRWITHFCAPVFVFLAGTGSYLQFARGKSKNELSRFLISRGLWLIVLEFTAVRLGAFFSFDPRFLALMQVIWVIGISMIVLAALIHLPLSMTAAFGISMIAFHNLLDYIPLLQVQGWRGPSSPVPGMAAKLWMILHQPGLFPVAGFPSPLVFVLYPLIPWIGVMAAGYAFGALYQKDASTRRRLLMVIGGIATALFIVMRAINIYGDPAKWSPQKNTLFTTLSFLNTTKYPPSLLFLLMTLGPAIAALAWFESTRVSAAASPMGPHSLFGTLRKALVTFGRVPLFFYLLQWPTAHGISILLHLAFGKPTSWLFQTPIDWANAPQGIGFNLAVVYAAWLTGVLLLYPLCKWFAGVKQRRRDSWLSYL
jgi:uncharacterized membrane protein